MALDQPPACLHAGWNLSKDELSVLDSLGALRLFERMARALLADKNPSAEAMPQVVRRILESGSPAKEVQLKAIFPKRIGSATPSALNIPVAASPADTHGKHARQRSASPCPASPKSMDSARSRADFQGESLFWQRLHGQGEFASGSTLRLLRQDALTKNWVCFMVEAQDGAAKPRQYKASGAGARAELRAHDQPSHVDKCPLCVGREEPTEVLRVWPNGELVEHEGLPQSAEDKEKWLVRVLRNPFPYLLTPQDLYDTPFPGDKNKHAACFGVNSNWAANPDADDPMYRMIDGFGASEVIVESPAHNALIGISTDPQVTHALRAMAVRGRALRKCPQVLQLMFFKQYGADASGSLVHPHMQLCTLPIVSGYLANRIQDHQEFFETHGCSAVQKLYVEDVSGGNFIAVSRMVHQTEHFVASVPFAQVARGRIVIAPRRHCPRFEDCREDELADLGSLLRLLLASLYRLRDDPSYNLFWESAPTAHAFTDPDERDMVEKSFCWTLHIRVPQKVSGFGLASGVDVTRQLPEEEAKELRGALLQEVASPVRSILFGSETPSWPPDSRQLWEFPATVGPFMMTQVGLSAAFNAFYEKQTQFPKPDPASDEGFMAGLDLCAVDVDLQDIVFCQLSPLHRITMTAATRAAAGIPRTACYFAWAYPAVQAEQPSAEGETTEDRAAKQWLTYLPGAERAFFKYGGYVYLGDDRTVVGSTSISPAALGTSLIFGGPEALPQAVSDTLTRRGRFQEITLEFLASKGSTHFGWLRPLEFQSLGIDCPNGGFAYKFCGGLPDKYFPVAVGISVCTVGHP